MKFEKTQRTPLVEIGSSSCLIKGECYPENIAEWSGPVLEALKKTLVDADTLAWPVYNDPERPFII